MNIKDLYIMHETYNKHKFKGGICEGCYAPEGLMELRKYLSLIPEDKKAEVIELIETKNKKLVKYIRRYYDNNRP